MNFSASITTCLVVFVKSLDFEKTFYEFFKNVKEFLHLGYTVCLNELFSRAQARTGTKLSLCLEYG